MQRKKFPIGIQTFREIREDDYYYVDKTEFALQPIKDKSYADKCRAEGLPIHLIGVKFSRDQRSVLVFGVERLCPTP